MSDMFHIIKILLLNENTSGFIKIRGGDEGGGLYFLYVTFPLL